MEDEQKKKISRKELDDVGKRNTNKNSYRYRKFNGQDTMLDEYTGKPIHISAKLPDSAYGHGRRPTDVTANTDHIVSIDKIREQYGWMLDKEIITTQDLKKITNSDYNLAEISERLNKAKGGMDNHQYLIKKLKEGSPEDFNTTFTMLQLEAASKIAMGFNTTSVALNNSIDKKIKINKNALNEIANINARSVAVGTESAIMTLSTSTVNNIVQLARKEKDVGEAISDIAKSAGDSFISSAGVDMLQSAMRECSKKIPNEALKNILTKNLPIQQISAIITTGGSIVRYLNDDITADECVVELVLNGLGTLVYTAGSILGGPAGAILSTIVVSEMNRCIIKYYQEVEMAREREKRFLRLTREALIVMEQQRKELQAMIDESNKEFHDSVDRGFEKLFISALNFDAAGIAGGLDSIMSVIGQHVRFADMQEYDKHFYSDEVFDF